jgi:small subunit ribosomal protein S21
LGYSPPPELWLTPLPADPIIPVESTRAQDDSLVTREVVGLADVRIAEGETFDSLLKRFNKRVQQDGILSEIRRRQHFESPSIRRKKKAAAKRRKSMRNS